MTDIIDRRHPEYTKRKAQWERQRDCIEGEDAIKSKTTTYLPSLSGQSVPSIKVGVDLGSLSDEPGGYLGYLRRASFLNATGRTVEALVGLLFTRPPKIEWPEASKDALADVGSGGESLDEILATSADEVVGIGRQGILVDLPPAEHGGDAYMVAYTAESIVDWEDGLVGGRRVKVRVNLYECDVSTDAAGKETKTERLRVLRLLRSNDEAEALAKEIARPIDRLSASDFTEGAVYVQVLYERVGEGGKSTVIGALKPQAFGGAVFREIPFEFIGPKNTLSKVSKPLLLDLATTNLSHYRNSADLEHGAFFTSIPQPCIAGGGTVNAAEFPIGAAKLWTFADANAKSWYLEFSGAGLQFLKDLMAEKRTQMAALGARLLQDETSTKQESGVALELRQRGDSSALARVAMALSEGYSKALYHLAFARGMAVKPSDVSVTISTDFGIRGLDAQMLTAILALVQAGVYSSFAAFELMKKGGLHPDETTWEEEQVRIEFGRPGGPGGEGAMGTPVPRQGGAGGAGNADDEREEKPDEKGAAA